MSSSSPVCPRKATLLEGEQEGWLEKGRMYSRLPRVFHTRYITFYRACGDDLRRCLHSSYRRRRFRWRWNVTARRCIIAGSTACFSASVCWRACKHCLLLPVCTTPLIWRPTGPVGVNRLVDWLNDSLTDLLTDSLADWLIDWLADRLTDWLINLLIVWLIDSLTDRLVSDWLIDWLNDCWLTDWLLIDWLTELCFVMVYYVCYVMLWYSILWLLWYSVMLWYGALWLLWYSAMLWYGRKQYNGSRYGMVVVCYATFMLWL